MYFINTKIENDRYLLKIDFKDVRVEEIFYGEFQEGILTKCVKVNKESYIRPHIPSVLVKWDMGEKVWVWHKA